MCIFWASLFDMIFPRMSELSKAFGNVLREHRTSKQWSQMKLAMEANMHINSLGNLERGDSNPTLESTFEICKALGVSVSEFMEDVEAELER